MRPGRVPVRVADPLATAGSRERLVRRLGLQPSTADVVRLFLDAALPESGATVLDAGCGRVSALRPFRARIADLVGVDVHPPVRPLPWLDRFILADLCVDDQVLPPASLDLVFSSFALEHLADPSAALRTLASWLRPNGWLVLTTVNRKHPFVNAYCALPRAMAGRLQRLVKAAPADAHPLHGACNTPAQVRDALVDAGFRDVELVTTDHLARAWGNWRPGFVAGLIGDLAAHRYPSRRSTIVARARNRG